MNNERYNQLIDEAYENYCKSFENQSTIEQYSFDTDPMSQLMFIGKIKTNPKFSKKWGLKIEERELSFKERRDLAHEYAVSHNKLPLCIDAYGHKGIPKYHEVINKTGWNIPTKLITVTYKDEKIKIYE